MAILTGRLMLFITIFIFFMIFLSGKHENLSPLNYVQRQSAQREEFKKVFMATALGYKSYAVINDDVFRKLGYYISEASIPIPKLQFVSEPVCEQVYSDWLDIALKSPVPDKPPKDQTESERFEYTLYGHALYTARYYNDRSQSSSAVWDKIDEYFHKPETMKLPYGKTCIAVKTAMQHYNLKDKKGAVIGSLTPWVEVFALKAGASEVLTVEYRQTTVKNTTRKVSTMHPFEFVGNFSKFSESLDFVATFSSIEHSGLQRYGDPADPIGDIREVLKVRCSLKPGGLFFLGLPRAQDHLTYNAHRIYGRIRLALLFTGFELLDVFRSDNPNPTKLQTTDFDGQTSPDGYTQDLFVLRKI